MGHVNVRGWFVRLIAPATFVIVENVCRTGGAARRETLDRARRELGLPPAKHPPRLR